jgi:inorganic pyrophosphatase
VKIEGWKDADAAKREIVLSVERYGKADPKPAY